MKPGESFVGQPVRSLQTMLRVIAEDGGYIPTVVPDGIYGPQTATAVSTFQRRHALPITGIVAAIVTTVITLLRYVRRGRLYIFGGAIMAVAVLSVVLEILMDITFCGYTFLGWCAYPAATFLTIGGLLIFLGICRPAREAMERKFFI